MPIYVIALIDFGDGEIVTEKLAVGSPETAEVDVKRIVAAFNHHEKEKYGDKANLRKFVGIEGVSEDRPHDWNRVNAYCDDNLCNTFVCVVCGLERKIKMSRPVKGKCYPSRTCRACNQVFASDKTFQNHVKRKHQPRRFDSGLLA